MKCERCGKDASVSVKAIINGAEHDFFLCEDCMKAYTGMGMSTEDMTDGKFHKININQANLKDLLSQFVPSLDDMIDGYYEYKYKLNNPSFNYMDGLNQRTCQTCGNLESNIRGGIFGCEDCYKLSDRLTNKVLKSYNNYDSYSGSLPKAEREFKEVALEIKSLQEKLQYSVETEDYEQAASLKEQIDDLNMKVKN